MVSILHNIVFHNTLLVKTTGEQLKSYLSFHVVVYVVSERVTDAEEGIDVTGA